MKSQMDWIIHIDVDELLLPSNARISNVSSLSLPHQFATLPPDVQAIKFHVHEAAIEDDAIVSPFHQVTLFKSCPRSVHKTGVYRGNSPMGGRRCC